MILTSTELRSLRLLPFCCIGAAAAAAAAEQEQRQRQERQRGGSGSDAQGRQRQRDEAGLHAYLLPRAPRSGQRQRQRRGQRQVQQQRAAEVAVGRAACPGSAGRLCLQTRGARAHGAALSLFGLPMAGCRRLRWWLRIRRCNRLCRVRQHDRFNGTGTRQRCDRRRTDSGGVSAVGVCD